MAPLWVFTQSCLFACEFGLIDRVGGATQVEEGGIQFRELGDIVVFLPEVSFDAPFSQVYSDAVVVEQGR